MPHPLRNRLLLWGNQIRYLLRATFSSKQGMAVDSHGENNLTNNAGVTTAVGKVSSAGQFTAASLQYLSIPDNADLSMGDIDFTVGAWVYLDTKTTARTILSKGTGLPNVEYALQYDQSTDRFLLYVGNGTTSGVITATTLGSPSLSTWYFVVAWHDATANTLTIQVNGGTPDSASYSGGSHDSATAFILGQRNNSLYMDGRIDQAFVTKRVLTAQERTDFYNAGAGLAYSTLTTAHKVSLVAWWEFEPLPASLPIDVFGPLTVTDTTNALSQSAGTFVFNGSPPSGTGIASPSLTRRAGLAFLVRSISRATPTARLSVYWGDLGTTYGNLSFVIAGATSTTLRAALTVIDTLTLGSGTWDLLLILRGTGVYALTRSGTGPWTLLWVENTDTGNHQARLATVLSTAATVAAFDDFRVLDLGLYDSRFATDYGLATSRLVSPTPGTTATSTPDANIEISGTHAIGVTDDIWLRYTDTNNKWRVRIDAASHDLGLYEVVAGVTTLRGTSAAAAAPGAHRIFTTLEGPVIKVYLDNVLKITYSSATTNQTATGIYVNVLNGPGAELISWPRTVNLPGNI